MSIRIALAGNPNSGKTTLFNALTGSSQYVGNWPGVTVEKKEGKLKSNKEIVIQDLPGIYSLSPYTLEEVVSRNYLVDDRPNVILNIVDASNLERNLYLTTQLAELNLPMVVALNMMDVVEKRGDKVNTKELTQVLGCPVVEISALKGAGIQAAADAAIAAAGKGGGFEPKHRFSAEVETALSNIQEKIQGKAGVSNPRWFAIKLFERDREILKALPLDASIKEEIEEITAACEEALDDDSESIITGQRYDYIGEIIHRCIKVKHVGQLSTSDKIDQIVTNRILALPIFIVVMFLVYFLSISTVGTFLTDWVNDGVFGEGFHLFGNGAGEFEEEMEDFIVAEATIDAIIEAAEEAGIEVDGAVAFLEEEHEDEEALDIFVEAAVAMGITAQAEAFDDGGEIFAVLEVNMDDFAAALEIEEPDPADFGTWIPGISVVVEEALESAGVNGFLTGLLVEGIIGGVGAVLGFLPQMLVLFLCLAFLEDCGYMSRIAFIMDRVFRKFGLSGKSFIPILIGTGCGVPGIMASRTIENENDRRMTVITTTFIPCGAKLPIIALIAGALFGGSAWVASSAYFLGIAAIICSGIMLKKTRRFAGDPAPFVMELPAYHMPGVKGVLRTMWERGMSFVRKAGTIVLLSTVFVWLLSSVNFSFQMVEIEDSILAAIGSVLAPLFRPLGFGDWQSAVATVTGLIAKENVVGTFGVLFGFAEVAENGREFWATLQGHYTPLAAYSFLAFNLLCAPCFAAIGAVRREMMSAKWTWFAIGYQTGLAYAVSLVIFQIGKLVAGGGFGIGTVAAAAVIVLFFYMMFRKPWSENKDDSARQPATQGAAK